MNYERSLGFTAHVFRAKRENFIPLSWPQYNTLCEKIETSLK